MNKALFDTIQFVTGKHDIKHTSQKEMQELIAEYPYFVPAQLVYAAKLKSDNSYQLQTQIQKAGLFFNNARWLQYQLMDISANAIKPTAKEEIKLDENKAVAEAKDIIAQEAKTAETIANTIEIRNPVAVEDETERQDFMATLNIPTVEEVKTIMNGIDEKKEGATEILAPTQTFQPFKPMQKIDVEEKESEEIKEKPAAEYISQPAIEHFTNNTKVEETVNENILPAQQVAENIIATEPGNDIHAQIAALKANWHKEHNTTVEQTVSQEEQQPLVAENISIAEAVPEKVIEANIAMPSLRADWDKPKEDFANALLPFESEPYYTIDYFASQGIKFDYNKEPHDKLTTKMLKFTDWLKKMKNVKPENMVVEEDPELDKAIQNIAASSNQSKEIVTETMAEIFAKQGKNEKAIQLYIKLSFLLPDKTAYFAAKIKELKGI